jgi:hypothetical protein
MDFDKHIDNINNINNINNMKNKHYKANSDKSGKNRHRKTDSSDTKLKSKSRSDKNKNLNKNHNKNHDKSRDKNHNKKKVKLYNSSKLRIDRSNTLVICDWDDTLFPTTWINEQNIDLSDIKSRYKYVRYFDVLDKYLSDSVRNIMKYGDLMIITNATLQWIYITLTVLPKTKKLFDMHSVPIVSARESYQNRCDMQDWKRHTFKAELLKNKTHYVNIISIGDAHYEHRALIDLYKWQVIPHKYLKSIKFTRSSDCVDLFNQLKIISNEIKNITDAQRHLDLSLDIVS